MAQLMRGEPPPDARSIAKAAKLCPRGRSGPWPPPGRPADNAEDRPDWKRRSVLEPGPKLDPAPLVHPDLATLSTLTTANDDRAPGGVKIALGEAECFRDSKAGAP
jgi:hypothetical protein